ncbi:hypothetical protein NM688_g4082 [Phlebia brevispora]|uniref:Uncharacterized protein n=1 Tax=Phlebia brevispora TaxID=194682 RepID=A0ACC1T3Q8_9APHY|nr:hypothetical protein NM688_g4082 [Phlebia brevispora]
MLKFYVALLVSAACNSVRPASHASRPKIVHGRLIMPSLNPRLLALASLTLLSMLDLTLAASVPAARAPSAGRGISMTGKGPGLQNHPWGSGASAGGYQSPPTTVDDFQDTLYTVEITLGGQQFWVQMDTGSADLWVQTQGTQSVQLDGMTDIVVSETYGAGNATGPIQFATLEFAFMLAASAVDFGFLPDIATGMMGLSFEAIDFSPINAAIQESSNAPNNTAGSTPIFNILSQNADMPSLFDIYLDRTDDLNDTAVGTLLIGSHQPGYESVSNQPQLPRLFPGRWAVPLDAMQVNGETFQFNKSSVSGVPAGKIATVLDSGFSFPPIPPAAVDFIYSTIPGSVFDTSGSNVWVVPCIGTANLTFTFGGVEIPVHYLDLTFVQTAEIEINGQYTNVTFCINTFQYLTLDPDSFFGFDAILGDAFLRNVYASFNYGEISVSGNQSYVQLLPTTDLDEALPDFLASRANVLSSMPPELSPSTFLYYAIQTMSSSNDEDIVSGAIDAASASSSTPTPSSSSIPTPSSSPSSSDDKLYSLVTKYGPVVVGLLAGNVIIGIVLCLIGLFTCVKTVVKSGARTRNVASTYAPVRFKEAEAAEENTQSWTTVARLDCPSPPVLHYTMSSKVAISGIKSLKRDWSSNSQPGSSSQSSDTPPPATRTTAPAKKSLTDTEKRLKAIQDALNGKPVPGETKSSSSQAHTTTAAGQKRPAPAVLGSTTNKRRQLPDTWSQEGTSQRATQSSRTTSSSNTRDANFESVTTLDMSSSRKTAAKLGPVLLSQEQTHILKLVEDGQVCFTLEVLVRTGKSVLLREIIKVLRKKHVRSADAVAVTASTGIAACNIGGVTIHSFAGIGIGEGDANTLATRVRKNKKAMARWLRTRVLIIDEISMVDGDLFDKLARLGSLIRKDARPFGGIQVVVTGDFFQLPPVPSPRQQVKFAFEAEFWPQTMKKTFNLTKVFRQSDPEFVDMLNEMRFGRLTFSSIARFKSLSRPLSYEDGVTATELFPRREDVERSNTARMRDIDSETHSYHAFDGGPLATTDGGQKMLANFMAPEKLVIKVGAQVMLIKNLDDQLVNGSMGTVTEFCYPQDFLTNPGDPYVNEEKPSSKPSSKVGGSNAASVGQKWPVVEFIIRQGSHMGKRRMLMQPETWKVELPNGELQVSRTQRLTDFIRQLPLILAWAMSIHKSQGQTLERCKVDLGRIFEKGQAYVALSRATSLDGLQVLNFNPNKVQAHPKVVEWSKTLQTVSE